MDTIEQRDEECKIPKHWQVQGCNASIEEAGAKILRKGYPLANQGKRKLKLSLKLSFLQFLKARLKHSSFILLSQQLSQ